MERPPKKYVCEKCGYLGDTAEHEGCDYLAWTTGEQLYIDHLEAELAALRASPASVPEGFALVPVDPTSEMLDCFIGATGARGRFEDMLAAAPTPPVSEDRKDAELWRDLVSHQKFNNVSAVGYAINRAKKRQAMQEDKP